MNGKYRHILYANGPSVFSRFRRGKAQKQHPKGFNCILDNATCNAALQAHPQWEKEAKYAIKHAWDGYRSLGCEHGPQGLDKCQDHVNTVNGGPGQGLDECRGHPWSIRWPLCGWRVCGRNFRSAWSGSAISVGRIATIRAFLFSKWRFGFSVVFWGHMIWVVSRCCSKKARDLGDRLSKAFRPNYPYPSDLVNLVRNSSSYSTSHSLAEIGTFQMEFRSLSHHTGDLKYKKLADDAMFTLMRHPAGLISNIQLSPAANGQPRNGGGQADIAGGADSYYEYLLKLYVQSGQTEPKFLRSFEKFYRDARLRLEGKTQNGFTYWGNNGEWHHLACFLPGTLILGNSVLPESSIDWNLTAHDWNLTAHALADTCQEMYARSPTGLGAESVQVSSSENISTAHGHRTSFLRPEAVESWYYLHYFTGDPKYRRWAHNYLSAMNKYARGPYGYSEVRDVNVVPPHLSGDCESFVIAETLKF